MASNQASARHPSTYPDQARKLNGVYVPYQPATNGAPSMVNGYAPQSPRQHVSPQQARPGSSGSSFPMTAPGYSPQQHHSPPRQQYPGGVLQWQPPQTTSASHWSHQLNGYSNGVPPPSSYPPIGNFGRPTSGSPPNTNSQQHRPSSQHSVQGTPANARPFYASSPLQQNGHPPPTLPPPSSASASVMTPRTTADMIPGAPFSQQSRTPGSSLPPLGQFGKSPSNLFGPSRPSAHSPIMPGLSPAKQESPRPSSSHSTLTATPVIPPVATLSPSFGNVQSMSPPTKKAAPDHLPENGEVGSRNR